MKRSTKRMIAAVGALLTLSATIHAEEPFNLEPALRHVKQIKATKLIEYARVISDQKYRGREAGRKGSRRTSDYLINHFLQWGLKPGGAAGTFYQTFKIEPGYRISSSLEFTVGGYNLGEITRRKDYALVHLVNNEAEIKASIAFAGYGISLPDEGFDEYENLDVKGKAVVVFTGVPWYKFPEKWGTKASANHLLYGGLAYKAMNAAKNGAVCLIVVENPIDWKSKVGADRTFRVPDFNSRLNSNIPVVHVSLEVLEQITKLSEQELVEISEDISIDMQPESMPIRGRTMKWAASVKGEAWVGRNVIAVIPGSDKHLRNEAIVIGAHYDHLGQDEKGTFFGANDNASGVSALLGVADAFSRKPVPKRSVIFIAFDAEEIGKRGSKHFVKNSFVGNDRIVFMINFDMIGKNAPNSINAVATRSSKQVHEIHQAVNKHVGLELKHPRSYRLGRSDHSPFYKANIPVMYLFGGRDLHYNTPEDTWEKLIPSKLEKVARLAYLTAYYVSNMDERVEFSRQQEP